MLFLMYDLFWSEQPKVGLHLTLNISWMSLMVVGVMIAHTIINLPNFNIQASFAMAGFMFSTTSMLGVTLGYYVRDTEGFRYDVTIKTEQLQNVGLVMMTSHHTVLYLDDQRPLVVPTADITKLLGRPRQTKKADTAPAKP
jgi:hypothetical protein